MWPGFVTSILQFETSSMLIIDVSHKVLRFRTVLDDMYEVYESCRRAPNFKELVAKKIIGQIVLTRFVHRECLLQCRCMSVYALLNKKAPLCMLCLLFSVSMS